MRETSPHVRESRIWENFAFVIHNPRILLLVKSGFWALKFRIQLNESRNPPVAGIWNPSSTDKESRIQYLESGIHSENPESKTVLEQETHPSNYWVFSNMADRLLLFPRFSPLSKRPLSQISHPGDGCGCQNPYPDTLHEVKFPWVACPAPPPLPGANHC